MFKRIVSVPAVSGAFLALANAAHAVTLKERITNSAEKTGGGAGLNTQVGLEQTIGSIIQTFLGLLGTVFVILMIYAGFLYMTAQGNEDQIEKSKNIIKNSVIGIVIIFLAYAITSFVLGAVAQ